MVDQILKLNNAAPSFHLHYRHFFTTTGCSVPVCCISTLTLMGYPLVFLPLHQHDRFPRSTQKPGSSSCHLYAGRRPDNKQAPSGLILELSEYPSFDAIADISTPHQWFAVAHLLDPHLIPSTGTFSLTLTTLALYQRSLRRFETCSYKPVPRGPPSSFAQLCTLSLYLKCARGTLRRIKGFDIA